MLRCIASNIACETSQELEPVGQRFGPIDVWKRWPGVLPCLHVSAAVPKKKIAQLRTVQQLNVRVAISKSYEYEVLLQGLHCVPAQR